MPDQTSAPLPVAGWYPDPENETSDRWWDGANWADHRRPRGAVATAVVPSAAPSAPPTVGGAYLPAGTAQPYGTGPAPYGSPYYGARPAQNVPALVGFILALAGFVLGYFTYGLLGLAGGIVSTVGLVRAKKMRAAGSPDHRYGMALTGVIVGYSAAVLSWLIVVAFIVFLFAAPMYSYSSYSSY